MLFGVLERLFVVHASFERVVLREFPFLQGLFIFGLSTSALYALAVGLNLTALGMGGIALALVLMARVRHIVIDGTEGRLLVTYRYVWGRRVQQDLLFKGLESGLDYAELREFADGSTQIILHTTRGEQGLSVCSRDIHDWKTPIVDQINDVLWRRDDYLNGAGLN